MLIEINLFLCKKRHFKMPSRIWRPQYVNQQYDSASKATCLNIGRYVKNICRKINNIANTKYFKRGAQSTVKPIGSILAGNTVVDHSGVVGASPTTPSFLTEHLPPMDWAETTVRRDEYCELVRLKLDGNQNGVHNLHATWRKQTYYAAGPEYFTYESSWYIWWTTCDVGCEINTWHAVHH